VDPAPVRGCSRRERGCGGGVEIGQGELAWRCWSRRVRGEEEGGVRRGEREEGGGRERGEEGDSRTTVRLVFTTGIRPRCDRAARGSLVVGQQQQQYRPATGPRGGKGAKQMRRRAPRPPNKTKRGGGGGGGKKKKKAWGWWCIEGWGGVRGVCASFRSIRGPGRRDPGLGGGGGGRARSLVGRPRRRRPRPRRRQSSSSWFWFAQRVEMYREGTQLGDDGTVREFHCSGGASRCCSCCS
jgi:hypothetical protein